MSRLTRNIIYNLLGQGLLLLLGLVAVRFVFRRLGGDGLGIIYFALTLNAVLSPALDLGMGTTTVREVSAHMETEPAYIHDLLRTFSSFYWGGYLLVAAGVSWGAPLLVDRWIKLGTLDRTEAAHALSVLSIGALLALPRSFYASILRGKQRMEFNNLIDVVVSAAQQAGMILILALYGSLLRVVYWLAACFVLSMGAYLCVCARFFSWEALIPGFRWWAVRRNLGFATRAASISFLAMVHIQADKAIVSKLLPLGVFGYYSFASNAISRSTLATTAVSQAALPSLSALYKEGDQLGLMAQYRKLQDLLCFGTVPLFAIIPFAALPLFTYSLNAGAARALLAPALFLCVGFYLNGTLNTPYVFSLAVGKPEIVARLNLYALFLVLPVTFTLVYFFGLNGAGFSWVFYHLVGYAYVVPRVCSECLKLPASAWFLHVLKVFGWVVLTYGIAWGVIASLGAFTIAPLALAYLVASAGFLLAAYFSIGPELRETFHRFLPLRERKPADAPTDEGQRRVV